ncbi:MAG: Divalent-cation tolerance protein CutA [Bryobacteraceae bacterium]|nr:Divalent-cation tolerance protein CutA [Bryobacteraceae bacterium]
MSARLVVLCASNSEEEARRIARAVVGKQLAACVNIVPGATSIYRWEGAIEEASEWLLLMKTTAAAYPHLEREIRALHSYSVPEIIALPIERGAESYLSWMDAGTVTGDAT